MLQLLHVACTTFPHGLASLESQPADFPAWHDRIWTSSDFAARLL